MWFSSLIFENNDFVTEYASKIKIEAMNEPWKDL